MGGVAAGLVFIIALGWRGVAILGGLLVLCVFTVRRSCLRVREGGPVLVPSSFRGSGLWGGRELSPDRELLGSTKPPAGR